MDPIVTQKLDELIANKKTVTVIADELQVSRQTVYKWLSKYKRDNTEFAKALRERSTLSAHNKIPSQIESVVISIAEKNPEDSVSALTAKLKNNYKIVLNSATVFRILKRNNIRYQGVSIPKEQLVEISQEIVPVVETSVPTPQVASFTPPVQTIPLPVLFSEPFLVHKGKDVNTRMFEGLYKLTATALAAVTCVLTVTYGATRFESGAIALKQTIPYNELSSPAFTSYANILPIREVVELIGIENRTAPATPTFTFIADSPRFKKSISIFSPRTFSLSKLGTATNSFVKNGPRLSVLSSVPLTNYTNYLFGGDVARAENQASSTFSLASNFSLLDRFSLALFCGVTSFSGEVKQERCNYSKLASLTETSTEVAPIPGDSVVVDGGAEDQQGSAEDATPSLPPSSPIYLTRYITQYIGVPGPAGKDGADGKDGVNGITSSAPEGYGSYLIPSYSSPATSIGVSTISYLRQTTIELPVITGGTATTLSLITPTVQGGVFSGHSLFNDSASFTGSVTINNLTATSSTVTNLTATNATTTNAYIDFLTVGSSTAGSLTLSGTLNVAGTTTLATTTASSFTTTYATTTNLFTQNLSVGNASTTGNQSIDGQFNVSGTSTLGAKVFLNGSVVVGTSSDELFTVNALVNSNITPSQNITYDLGSPSFYWRNLYANNINVNSISAASTTISGTSNNDFIVNSDNGSSDAEDASFVFFRGLSTPNALLRWNSATKRIESNMSFKVQNETPTTGTTTLTVQAGAGQGSTNLFELINYAGTKLSAFTSQGWLGIGTTTPSTSLHLTTNDGLIIPAGTTAQRPSTTLPGVIRYNTTNTGFEGFNGSTWGSLGGVSDADQNTYISAENSAGSNNDELKFYTAGTLRGIFSSTGNFGIGTSTPGSMLTVVGTTSLATTTITGTLTVNGNTNITQGGTLTVGDKVIAPGEIGAGTSSPSGKIAIQSTLANQVAFLIYGTSTQIAPLIDVFDYPGSNQNIFRLSATGTLSAIGGSFGSLAITGQTNLGTASSTGLTATNVYGTNSTITNATSSSFFSTLISAVTAAFTNLSTTGTTTLATTGGNVGIGTTTPTSKLDLWGNLAVGTSSTPTLFVNTALGNVGIGTSIGTSTLFVQGAGTMNPFTVASSSGTSLFSVLANGNVGVGTSSPTHTLDVNGIVNATNFYKNGVPFIAGSPANTISSFNQSTCPAGWILADGTSGTPDLRGVYVRGAGTSGSYTMANGSPYTSTYGTFQNDAFQGHAYQPSLYAQHLDNGDGAGYALINVANFALTVAVPSGAAISDGVNGAPRISTETRPGSYSLIYCMKTTEDANTTSTIWGSSGNNVFLQDTSKNLGIGTTSPTSVFTVASSTATSTASIFSVASTTTLFNVLANGNVGIGASPLNFKLQVNGSVKLGGLITIGRSGGNYDSVGYNFRTTGTSDSYLYDVEDFSSRLEFFQGGFYFKSSGSGTAGNAISYTNTFIVEQTGNATLAGTLTQNSDQRLKTNITSLPSSYGLDSILKLNPVTYIWKDTNRGTSTQIGFLAQQVQSFFPELVTRSSATTTDTPDGTLGLNYIDLIAPAIKAIQDLNSVFNATNALNASSTIFSYYQGTTTPAITVGATGVLGIGNNGISLGGELLRVSGTVRATGFDIDNASDIAETFPAAEAVDAGTIVAFATSTYAWSPTATSTDTYDMSGVRKAQSDYEAIGIISTQPGIRLGGTTANGVPVAFTGRVPVKVTKENGEIKRGDYITVSKTRAGYGMKLTGEGKAVGVALSDDTGRDTVLVLLQVGNHKLDMQGRNATTTAFLTTGNLDLNANGVAITNIKSLASANGTWSIDENGKIVAKMLCLDEVCIDKSVLSTILNSFGQSGAVAGTTTSVDVATTTPTETGTTTPDVLSTASTTPSTTATTTEPVVTPTPTEPAPTPEPVPTSEPTPESTPTPEPTPEPMSTPVEPTPITP